MRDLRTRLISSLVFLFALGISAELESTTGRTVGGLAAGFCSANFSRIRAPMNNAEKQRAQILGWFAGLAILASFVLIFCTFAIQSVSC